MIRLMTAQQVCDHFGIPSPRTIKTMRQKGLAGVRLGKAYLFDAADVAAYIQDKKTSLAQTVALASNGLQNARRSTSSGSPVALGEFALRALESASRLKKPSPLSSVPHTSSSSKGRVTRQG